MQGLKNILPKIQEAGGELIAISPELPDNSLSLIEQHSLEFQVLSDLGNKAAEKFGIVFSLAEELRPIYTQFGFNLPERNGDDTWQLPFPASYVVDKDGVIVHSFINADHTKRAEPDDILKALKQIC